MREDKNMGIMITLKKPTLESHRGLPHRDRSHRDLPRFRPRY
jgi:hypothetical protein